MKSLATMGESFAKSLKSSNAMMLLNFGSRHMNRLCTCEVPDKIWSCFPDSPACFHKRSATIRIEPFNPPLFVCFWICNVVYLEYLFDEERFTRLQWGDTKQGEQMPKAKFWVRQRWLSPQHKWHHEFYLLEVIYPESDHVISILRTVEYNTFACSLARSPWFSC